MDKKKIAIIAVVSFVVLIVGVFGFGVIQRMKTVEQANALVSMEKYKDGIAMYEKLLSKNYDKAVADRRDRAIELMESKANYEKALEFCEKEDYKKAIACFLKVSKNDKKRYSETSEQMNAIEEQIIAQIKDEFEYGDDVYAMDMLNDYLKAVPNSTAAKNLKDDLRFAKEEEKAKQEQEFAEAERQAAEEEKASEASYTAYNVSGTYQTIIAKNANLRVAPKLDAAVITTVPQGSECYVYETKIETAERIWCQVEYMDDYGEYYVGWVSYNTMNYKY
ncbi:hypothetical protein EAL2_808p00230 (plasmid) [Peptoclostridium acidaminophilum DSM 3953]|uniref:SH3b domain-containing protein n=1 Tax=Peptoclostridium acidaminophilum DSM 3953 TaxID=1286171 RepID=W8T9D1_PEPAC|nr:SH3 domain-containing protein [Peptoclostridium acidaminophilum]AHM57530.1 hypothetical protein EAL2_808p00230 [Peptoclostridium acidaminophilum DSM 3953]